ncbi:hypothetical protein BH23BAC3_BH23BAC3_32420 [soil metagenome]
MREQVLLRIKANATSSVLYLLTLLIRIKSWPFWLTVLIGTILRKPLPGITTIPANPPCRFALWLGACYSNASTTTAMRPGQSLGEESLYVAKPSLMGQYFCGKAYFQHTFPCDPSLCREVREHRRSLTCCNKDDATRRLTDEASATLAGGVVKPLHAANAVRLLW